MKTVKLESVKQRSTTPLYSVTSEPRLNITELAFRRDTSCVCEWIRHHSSSEVSLGISISSDVGLHIVQELCESRGGRPGLYVLTSLLVSVDVKNY